MPGLTLLSLVASVILAVGGVAPAEELGTWQQLAPLPTALGVAAPFAGVTDGALLVAGGANFPAGFPWEGGRKAWHDTAWLLPNPQGAFREVGKLPRPLAYGVSITARKGLLCIGGCDADHHYANAFELRWDGAKLSESALPPLPIPVAYACGALLGDTGYVACGTEEPGEKRASNRVFALNLKAQPSVWRELPPLPGKPRLLATAAVADESFFILGGVALEQGGAAQTARVYLRDAWRFREGAGWQQLPDLPQPNAAAPSPAPVIDGKILLIAGDDGSSRNFEPVSQHPGFVPAIFAFDVKNNRWSEAGRVPAARATAPCVVWNGAFVIPSGEVRPGVRSPEVWRLTPAR
jgi:N-acetylneuraminic acid mutarotase